MNIISLKMDLVKKVISLEFIVAIIVSIFSCTNINKEYVSTAKDEKIENYVLNTNSMKVHIERCVSAHKISEKNRKDVSDKLSNIINNGYSICKNCKAGLRKEDIIQNIKDKYLYSNLLIEEPKDLPTVEEYLNAIETMGEWYVSNVPTYMSELEEEKIEEYAGNDRFVERYQLRNRYKNRPETSKFYNVITDNISARLIGMYHGENVLKANKNAVSSYGINYDKIKFTKTLAYYDCEHIRNSEDDYKKAGDDCVRFMFSVLNCIDKRFTRLFKLYSKISWSKLNTSTFYYDKEEIAYAMKVLGFDIYDLKSFCTDINGDSLIDVEANRLDSNFKLENGDILVKNGHTHFYLDNESQGYSYDFGCGKVNRNFPQKSERPSLVIKNDNYLINFRGSEYTRVYRYVGK